MMGEIVDRLASEFPKAVVDYSTVDGVNYGVPFDSGTAIGAYRTDVLAEAGYTVADFTDITNATRNLTITIEDLGP